MRRVLFAGEACRELWLRVAGRGFGSWVLPIEEPYSPPWFSFGFQKNRPWGRLKRRRAAKRWVRRPVECGKHSSCVYFKEIISIVSIPLAVRKSSCLLRGLVF